MTKAELEKEAEEFIDTKKSFWRQGRTCIDSVKQAYIVSAEPREKRIEELEKKNAELKEQSRELLESCEGATMMYKDLCKAKEIIKKLKALYFSPVVTKDDVKRQDEILADVEQFLKE